MTTDRENDDRLYEVSMRYETSLVTGRSGRPGDEDYTISYHGYSRVTRETPRLVPDG